MKFLNIFDNSECMVINLDDTSRNRGLKVNDEVILKLPDPDGRNPRAILKWDFQRGVFYLMVDGRRCDQVQGIEVL